MPEAPRGGSSRYGHAVPTRRPLSDRGFRALNWIHRSVIKVTGGHLGRRAFGMSIVELATRGRESGLERRVMLTVPVEDGERLVLVASKGGSDHDPDWYSNLLAHPEVDVTLRGVTRPMTARRATTEEASALWPRVIAAYQPYADYRRRARREIPLVVCEPREIDARG